MDSFKISGIFLSFRNYLMKKFIFWSASVPQTSSKKEKLAEPGCLSIIYLLFPTDYSDFL
jgi:hypothetical protein